MKSRRLRSLKTVGIAAIGVFLGRGAEAGTILTFDTFPTGVGNNDAVPQTFGDNAAASSPGVSVVGAGTPNIGLSWSLAGNTRWEYYIDPVWSAAQLNGSTNGAIHSLTLSPDPSAAVMLNSFNFHPYYNTGAAEHYDYAWSVLSGATTLASGTIGFDADATKNHLVNINFAGGLGQELVLSIRRAGGPGGGQNIAIDDISFSQIPEPRNAFLLALGGVAAFALRKRRPKRNPGLSGA